jgi:hypothetical protein
VCRTGLDRAGAIRVRRIAPRPHEDVGFGCGEVLEDGRARGQPEPDSPARVHMSNTSAGTMTGGRTDNAGAFEQLVVR